MTTKLNDPMKFICNGCFYGSGDADIIYSALKHIGCQVRKIEGRSFFCKGDQVMAELIYAVDGSPEDGYYDCYLEELEIEKAVVQKYRTYLHATLLKEWIEHDIEIEAGNRELDYLSDDEIIRITEKCDKCIRRKLDEAKE